MERTYYILVVDPTQNGPVTAILDFHYNYIAYNFFIVIRQVAPPYCIRPMCTICNARRLRVNHGAIISLIIALWGEHKQPHVVGLNGGMCSAECLLLVFVSSSVGRCLIF